MFVFFCDCCIRFVIIRCWDYAREPDFHNLARFRIYPGAISLSASGTALALMVVNFIEIKGCNLLSLM